MTGKILDFVLYGAATVVILSVISAATQAERESNEEVKQYDLIEIEQPALVEDPKETLVSEVIFTSQENCPPCKAFEANCVTPLRKAGWRVTKRPPDGRSTPSFDIKLGGRIVESKTGYKNRGSFFRWLKKTVEVKR